MTSYVSLHEGDTSFISGISDLFQIRARYLKKGGAFIKRVINLINGGQGSPFAHLRPLNKFIDTKSLKHEDLERMI